MLALKRSLSLTESCLSKQKIRSCPTMESQPVIDENLQSRQQAVYGKEAMMRMAQSNVLIVGMNGVGAEVAKDLILANMNAVTLADTANVVISDLSSQFYLSEHDVGQNRAAACLERMKELNPAVRVSAHLTAVTEELLAKHRVVVLCDGSLADAESINEICHKNNIPFVRAESRGVFSVVFSDFGDAFTVADENGEQPATNILASVSNTNPVVAFVIEDELPAVSEGDLVTFREVKGMIELNSLPAVRVKSVNHKTKEITFDVDGTSMGAYRGGGTICQVKQPKTFTFKPLREALRNPGELIITDYAKFGRAEQLHVAFIALHRYMAKNQGALPQPSVERDAAAFVSLAQEVHAEFAGTPIGAGDLDLDLMAKFANVSAGSLSPMAAIVGGLAAQEAIKACALKYTPLTQFLYFDCVEALPSSPLPPSEVAPLGSRYDGQIAVFGRTLQELMGEQHVFLVGAGALGCEFLKNYPMMGVCCGAGGLMTVTDDDVIEKSNLSRQFLFRNWHIGQSKSTSAVEQARAINASLKASPLISRVAPNTEHVFNDTFWETQNVITNALDNVPARLYVDQRCMYFAKPLLESGTLGTKLNTQVCQPQLDSCRF
jgi:ubiquitin-activating enzyme E1